jgi:hypothetical protein
LKRSDLVREHGTNDRLRQTKTEKDSKPWGRIVPRGLLSLSVLVCCSLP